MNSLKYIIFICCIALLSSCSDNNKLKISGSIKGGNGKTLYLQKLNLENYETLDSVKLNEDGDFKFYKERLKYPEFFLLKLSDTSFITLLADTTEKIEIEANAKDLTNSYSVKNSIGSAYIKTLNRKLSYTNNAIDSLKTLLKKEEDKTAKQEILKKINEVIQKQKNFIFDFVMTNPRSFASYYAVFQRFDNNSLILDPYNKKDLNTFTAIATSLNILYPESQRAIQLKNFVLGIKKEERLHNIKQELLANADVKTLPEINQPNTKGDSIKLSSLRGKMVLLSFWASWDKNSRIENKRLVRIYKKYKSKGLEIYQVSLDKSKVLWEEAILEDKLPWINVSDLKYTNSTPAKSFNIQQIPANYLINPKGEIIGKNLFGTILDDKLKDLLK